MKHLPSKLFICLLFVLNSFNIFAMGIENDNVIIIDENIYNDVSSGNNPCKRASYKANQSRYTQECIKELLDKTNQENEELNASTRSIAVQSNPLGIKYTPENCIYTDRILDFACGNDEALEIDAKDKDIFEWEINKTDRSNRRKATRISERINKERNSTIINALKAIRFSNNNISRGRYSHSVKQTVFEAIACGITFKYISQVSGINIDTIDTWNKNKIRETSKAHTTL